MTETTLNRAIDTVVKKFEDPSLTQVLARVSELKKVKGSEAKDYYYSMILVAKTKETLRRLHIKAVKFILNHTVDEIKALILLVDAFNWEIEAKQDINIINEHKYKTIKDLISGVETEIKNIKTEVTDQLETILALQSTLSDQIGKMLSRSFEKFDWQLFPQKLLPFGQAKVAQYIHTSILIPVQPANRDLLLNQLLENEKFKLQIQQQIFGSQNTWDDLIASKHILDSMIATLEKNADLLFHVAPSVHTWTIIQHDVKKIDLTTDDGMSAFKSMLINLLYSTRVKNDAVDVFTKFPTKFETDNSFDYNINSGPNYTEWSEASDLFNFTNWKNNLEKLYETPEKNFPCLGCLGANHPPDFHIFNYNMLELIHSHKQSNGRFLSFIPQKNYDTTDYSAQLASFPKLKALNYPTRATNKKRKINGRNVENVTNTSAGNFQYNPNI